MKMSSGTVDPYKSQSTIIKYEFKWVCTLVTRVVQIVMHSRVHRWKFIGWELDKLISTGGVLIISAFRSHFDGSLALSAYIFFFCETGLYKIELTLHKFRGMKYRQWIWETCNCMIMKYRGLYSFFIFHLLVNIINYQYDDYLEMNLR